MSNSRAHKNRAIRQEALREQLSAQGHVQHIVDMINKIANLDEELAGSEVNRLNVAINAKLKLVNKYLPDLKSAEILQTIEQNISVDTNQLSNEQPN